MNIHEHVASLTAAQATLSAADNSLQSKATDHLPQAQKLRLPEAQEYAQQQMERANSALTKHRRAIGTELTMVVRSKRSFEARYDALIRAATEFGNAVGPLSACKRGCSHCCHIPVTMAQSEAELIGKRIRVRPSQAKDVTSTAQREYGYRHPCPFLENDACSIYENRPLACRLQYNMDRDNLLCELIPEGLVPVPYADSRQFQMLYTELCADSQLGELREFFPRGKAKPAR